MFSIDKEQTHRRLMGRMATTIGADLHEAALRGDFSPEAEVAAVQRCCGCRSVGTCEDWLEDHVDGAEQAPGFCANRAVLAEFAPKAAE